MREQIFSAGAWSGLCSVAGGSGILGLCDLLVEVGKP